MKETEYFARFLCGETLVEECLEAGPYTACMGILCAGSEENWDYAEAVRVEKDGTKTTLLWLNCFNEMGIDIPETDRDYRKVQDAFRLWT